MAKKAKAEVDDGNEIGLNSIIKKYGDVISTGNQFFEKKKNLTTLKISPSWDLALNGGLQEGSWTIFSGNPKCGKEQPISSLVYTPKGPITMGDIKVGDIVCNPEGGTSKVIAVHLNGIKDVYRVYFNDETFAECGLDHLWKVGINYHGSEKEKILSLREIINNGLFFSDRPKFKIQLTKEVEFNSIDISLDPYILGCLIGDGGLTGGSVTITNEDEEIISKFRSFCLDRSLFLNKTSEDGISYRVSCGINNGTSLKMNSVINDLRDLRLFGLSSHEKFIPVKYKYNSTDVRYSVIRGLMDTDGFNDYGKRAEYTTVSVQLALDVVEVVQSLGYTAKIKRRFTKCNGKEFPSYRISISGNDVSRLFGISRKKYSRIRSKNKLFRTIRRIELVRQEECRCIELDSENHLYLTNNFAVTHNSTTVLQIAANAQKEGRNVIYIDAESRLKGYNLSGIDGLDLDKIQIVHSPEDKTLSAEDFLEIGSNLIKMPKNSGAVCIIDSSSSLVPRSELDAEASGSLRATLPKLLSHWVKKTAQTVTQNKIIMILITHYITNTSGYGKVKIPDCGVMVQYQADTRIDFNKTDDWEEDGEKIGIICNIEISCSSLGASGKEAKSYIRFGHGIDSIKETIELGELYGLINKAGAWYNLEFLENHAGYEERSKEKFQGQVRLYEHLVKEKDVYDLLQKELSDILK